MEQRIKWSRARKSGMGAAVMGAHSPQRWEAGL